MSVTREGEEISVSHRTEKSPKNRSVRDLTLWFRIKEEDSGGREAKEEEDGDRAPYLHISPEVLPKETSRD